jgi:hypothetical protein
MILTASPPALSLPHEGGGKRLVHADARDDKSTSLPPAWGKVGVGGPFG